MFAIEGFGKIELLETLSPAPDPENVARIDAEGRGLFFGRSIMNVEIPDAEMAVTSMRLLLALRELDLPRGRITGVIAKWQSRIENYYRCVARQAEIAEKQEAGSEHHD